MSLTDWANDVQATLAHPAIQLLAQRLTMRAPVEQSPYQGSRLAAVAALIRIAGQSPGSAELLFIKRAVIERDPWSGHIAFPGGRHDASDGSLEQTATRETREELSIDIAKDGLLLGRVDDLAPRSRALPPIIVRPFVGIVKAGVEITINDEVDSAFWVPIERLRDMGSRGEHVMMVNNAEARFPAYVIDAHVVWGLTERIVAQLLELFDGD